MFQHNAKKGAIVGNNTDKSLIIRCLENDFEETIVMLS